MLLYLIKILFAQKVATLLYDYTILINFDRTPSFLMIQSKSKVKCGTFIQKIIIHLNFSRTHGILFINILL